MTYAAYAPRMSSITGSSQISRKMHFEKKTCWKVTFSTNGILHSRHSPLAAFSQNLNWTCEVKMRTFYIHGILHSRHSPLAALSHNTAQRLCVRQLKISSPGCLLSNLQPKWWPRLCRGELFHWIFLQSRAGETYQSRIQSDARNVCKFGCLNWSRSLGKRFREQSWLHLIHWNIALPM